MGREKERVRGRVNECERGREGERERGRDTVYTSDQLLAAGLLKCQQECCSIRLAPLVWYAFVLCGVSDPLYGEFVP